VNKGRLSNIWSESQRVLPDTQYHSN